MTLVKLNPYRNLANLTSNMDSFFNNFGYENDSESVWAPRLDIVETEKHYEVVAELPGVDKNDINIKGNIFIETGNIYIKVEDGMLVLSGEKKSEHEEKEGEYVYTERRYGKFERSFRLPKEVKADEIKARYENGVLNVNIPKSEKAQPKQISIN